MLHALGGHIVSTDELTGVQALERIAPSQPMRPGRPAFLSDPTHRISFVYVPKHTSWLNQIEIWLSILVRRVIRRGNFSSVDALRTRILAFIDYFNQTAKPFKWTYTGRPLVA